MLVSDLIELLFANKQALQQAEEQYNTDGFWHVEMCNCQRCQALEAWQSLPWHQKAIARFAAFLTYGTN